MTGSDALEPKIVEIIGRRGLVLFDTTCGFCSFWVHFISARDRRKQLVFAPLQVEWAKGLLESAGDRGFDTVLLYDQGVLHSRSDAVVHIARCLSFPWNLVWFCRLIPRVIRDGLYRQVAKNRHRLCKSSLCSVAPHQDTELFIDV